MEILSLADIENCRENLNIARKNVDDYYNRAKSLEKILNDEDIVQTFFKSGLLGSDVQTNFQAILEIMNKYMNSFNELYGSTSTYLKRQEDANNGI